MSIDKPNYTQIPNTLLDELMMLMDGSELKVTLAIARQTFGYHRERHSLSLAELRTLTGLSKQSVVNGLEAGVRRGIISRSKGKRGGFVYELLINGTSPKTGQVDKANEMTSPKNVLSPVQIVDSTCQKSGQEAVQKVDSATPTLKKEKETNKEKGEEEETHARVSEAWIEAYQDAMPKNIVSRIDDLVTECGLDAVIYGIRASVEAGARNFKYIASCARNYIPCPEGSQEDSGKSYQVHLPPASKQPVYATPPVAPKARPESLTLADAWTQALAELIPTLPGPAISYLTGSRLQEGDNVDDVPLYTVVLEARAAGGFSWLTVQAGPAIRRKLTSILGHPVLVEFTCEGEM